MDATERDDQFERQSPLRTPEPPEQSSTQLPRHAMGNRRFGQVVARMRDGGGILPGGVVHPDVEAAISASRGRGRPLDDGLAATLGRSMGASFRNVRVHADEGAAELARAVDARAFTVGNDIYFGRGQYKPGTADGKSLIAHELTHTIQQQGAPLEGPLTVSQPGDPLERQAEAMASHGRAA